MADRLRQGMAVGACILGGLVIMGLAALIHPKDPACVRLQARVDLADKFCEGLAERAAREKCSSLSEVPDVMGQCLRVMRPAASSGCMDYLNLEKMKEDLQSACP